jgi:hypothetical protein
VHHSYGTTAVIWARETFSRAWICGSSAGDQQQSELLASNLQQLTYGAPVLGPNHTAEFWLYSTLTLLRRASLDRRRRPNSMTPIGPLVLRRPGWDHGCTDDGGGKHDVRARNGCLRSR